MASRGYLPLAHRQSTCHSPPRHVARWVHPPARLRAREVCGSATVWLCRQTAAMQGIPAAVLYDLARGSSAVRLQPPRSSLGVVARQPGVLRSSLQSPPGVLLRYRAVFCRSSSYQATGAKSHHSLQYLQWLAQRCLLRLSLSGFAIFSPYCLDYFIVRDI